MRPSALVAAPALVRSKMGVSVTFASPTPTEGAWEIGGNTDRTFATAAPNSIALFANRH